MKALSRALLGLSCLASCYSIEVTPREPEAPTANDDSFTTDEDVTLNIPFADLLANDEDLNADTLTISTISAASGGVVTRDDANEQLVFVPTPDFNGLATFTYSANDGTFDAVATVSITVNSINDPPIADPLLTGTSEDVPVSMSFTGTDAEGDAITFRVVTPPLNGTVTSVDNINFTYTPDANANGPDSFEIAAVDAANAVPENNTAVVVDVDVLPVNDSPVATSQTITLNEFEANTPATPIALTATDVDGDTLTFTVIGLPEAGSIGGNEPNINYTAPENFFTAPGAPEVITFLVEDNLGGVDQGQITITVNNLPDVPVFNAQGLKLQIENTTVTYTITGTDVDQDGLTFEISTPPSNVGGLDPGVVTALTQGSPNDQVATFTYQAPDLPPTGEEQGRPVTLGLRVNDGTQDSAEVIFNLLIKGSNATPVAGDDSLTTDEDTPIVINEAALLANDTDADNDPLFVESFSNVSNCVPTIVNGTITVSFAPNFNGTASFDYEASDSLNGGFGTVTIAVNAINDGPINTVPGAQTTAEDTNRVFSFANGNPISLVDVDANLIEETITATNGTVTLGSTAGLNFAGGVGDGTNDATMTFTGSVTAVNNALATLTFIPSPNFNGAASLLLSTSDLGNIGAGGVLVDSDTINITVTEVNDPPVAVNDTATNTNEDTQLVFAANTLLTNDSTGPANESAQTLTVTNVSAASTLGGAVTLSGGNITYTPPANAFGADSFTYTITDNGTTNGAADPRTANATVTVNIVGVNDEPTFDAIGTQTVLEDSGTTNITITGVSAGPANEGTQALNFSATSNNIALIPNPSITGSGATRTLSFLPNLNQNGSAIITVTLTDDGGTASGGDDTLVRTFTINVTAVNDEPFFDVINNQTVNEDSGATNITITGVSTGPANESGQIFSAFTAVSNNTSLIPNPTISGSGVTRTLSFTPAANQNGSATITVTAQDDGGTANGGDDTLVRTFTINVTAVNDAPANTVPGNQTILEDATRVFNTANGNLISVNDIDAGASNIQITLTTTNGVTTLASTTGLTVSGNGTANLTATGNLTNINSGLNGLIFTPTANVNGVASFTLLTSDLGNTGTGGALTDSDSVTINITAVNDEPTFDAIGTQTVLEDSGASNITITGVSTGPANESGQAFLAFTASSDNTSLIPNPIISGSGNTRTLSFTPAANQNGSAIITVTAQDDGGTANGGDDTLVRTFTINVTAVNDEPTFDAITDRTVNEDSGTTNVTITGVSTGPANESGQAFSAFTAVSNNTSLIPNPTISGSGNTRTLSFTPATNQNGTATITVTAQDNGGTANGGDDTLVRSFVINVTAVNDAPATIVPGAQTTAEEVNRVFSVANGNAITAADIDVGANNMELNLTTSNAILTLASTTGLTVTGNNSANVTITGNTTNLNNALNGLIFDPNNNFNGAASIVILSSDLGNTGTGGILTDSDTINITVTEVNDAPTANDDIAAGVFEDSGAATIAISSLLGNDNTGPANESGQSLSLSLPNNTTTLGGTVTISGANVIYTPAANTNGIDSFTYLATDNGTTNGVAAPLSDTAIVTIDITAVNDEPTFDAITDRTVNEDSGASNVTITGVSTGPANESGQAFLAFTASSDNTSLIPNPTISGSGNTRTLSFTPVANQNGSAIITVTAQDNGGTANGGDDTLVRTFTINVTAVNDEPTFDAIGTQTVLEDSGASNVTITGVSTGPANESGQIFSAFTAVSDNAGLIPNPVISGSGNTRTLSFTPAANQNGSAIITVTAQDNGGTANGGDDTLVRTFTINVTAVNDAPTLDVIANRNAFDTDGATNLTLTGVSTGPANESAQTITSFTAASDNVGVIPNPSITGSGATRTLTFDPVLGQSGTAIITVTIQDDGGTANSGVNTLVRTFSIAVATCGGGEITAGELCDDGAHCQNGVACANDSNCTGIGDGLCRARNGDGCSETCQVESGFNCFNLVTADSTCIAVGNDRNGDGPTAEADECTLLTTTVSVDANDLTTALQGRIEETDETGKLTTGTGANALIRGEVGFGPANSNPITQGGWSFFLATFSADTTGPDVGDIYTGQILAPSTTGTFEFTYRFSFDDGLTYTYCDDNGAGSDTGLNFNANNLGTMTVNP